MGKAVAAPLVFLDTETTGLDPARHEIWEIGCIVQGHRDETCNGEWWFQLRPNLTKADPGGLRVGRYYEREQLWRGNTGRAVILASPWWNEEKRKPPYPSEGTSPAQVAHRVARLLDGAHMVGAVPSFDAAFLGPFLRGHDQAPTWHYHLVDVEALAAGKLGQSPPWDSSKLTADLGVVVPEEDKHTALGDARWAKAVYDAVLGA